MVYITHSYLHIYWNLIVVWLYVCVHVSLLNAYDMSTSFQCSSRWLFSSLLVTCNIHKHYTSIIHIYFCKRRVRCHLSDSTRRHLWNSVPITCGSELCRRKRLTRIPISSHSFINGHKKHQTTVFLVLGENFPIIFLKYKNLKRYLCHSYFLIIKSMLFVFYICVYTHIFSKFVKNIFSSWDNNLYFVSEAQYELIKSLNFSVINSIIYSLVLLM